MKKDKSLKNIFKDSILNTNEFYVKLCFTILFVVIFVVSFFSFEGYKYFYSVIYADEFKGYNFQIHTINVEQGDCFLLKFPNNQCMLIDTGEEEYSEIVCEYIDQFFIAENIKKIDYLLLTHPDTDHIGGAKAIMKKYKVETLLRPPVYSYSENLRSEATQNFDVDESLIYDEVIMYAYENGINNQIFQKGMKFDFGGCKAEFLSPKLQSYSSNNYSGVVMFSLQNKKFLFMGDAESEIEQELIQEYGNSLRADVLKVGHHGSNTSSSQDFIDVVAPEFALISNGGNSRYFPNTSVVNRLENANASILSTAEQGNFVVGIKNNSIVYSIAKRPPNIIALIFALVLIVVFIIWENPFKKYKALFLQKKTDK